MIDKLGPYAEAGIDRDHPERPNFGACQAETLESIQRFRRGSDAPFRRRRFGKTRGRSRGMTRPSIAEAAAIMSNAIDCDFTVEGSGPPLFLIHGIGAARDVWRFVTFRC